MEHFTSLDTTAEASNRRRRGAAAVSGASKDASSGSSTTPILIIDVSCGSDNLGAHTAAVSSAGSLYCWGVGGAVGSNSMTSTNSPIRLGDDTSVAGKKFIHVACGASFLLMIHYILYMHIYVFFFLLCCSFSLQESLQDVKKNQIFIVDGTLIFYFFFSLLLFFSLNKIPRWCFYLCCHTQWCLVDMGKMGQWKIGSWSIT